MRVKKARGRGNLWQSFSDPQLEIRSYVVKPRTAGEAGVKSQNKGMAGQRSLIFWVWKLQGVHIFTLILQLGMISGDLVLKTSLRLSPGLTGVHGNRLVMSDTQSWGVGEGQGAQWVWKERALLWPRQPQQYSWNGDLGQRSNDSVTVFNMCPACYFSGNSWTKWYTLIWICL